MLLRILITLLVLSSWAGCTGSNEVEGEAPLGQARRSLEMEVNGVRFAWSYQGPIAGMTCVQVLETRDPDTWNDNYLCTSTDIGLRWSYQGVIAGMRCTQVNESSDPYTWNDNFLCLPESTPFELLWSMRGTIPGQPCLAITEPLDPHGWEDNFLCAWRTSDEVQLSWSYQGPIAGQSCTQLLETRDPHTWDDNYLCASRDIGLRWSNSGPIAGLRCTQVREPSDPYTWDDNYLCLPQNSPFTLLWSYNAAPIKGHACVQVDEPLDPHTWTDNFVCLTRTMPEGLQLSWSYQGPLADQVCTLVNEPSDPNTWTDNYLCASQDLGLKWSYNGPISGMRCEQLLEPSDPHSWTDNYLCLPQSSPYQLLWSSSGPRPDSVCVQVTEIRDPDGWTNNYLCLAHRSGKDVWQPLVTLRDNTSTWPTGKPSGGWWVTPIHATMLPATGEVLISGWVRPAPSDCMSDMMRKYGVTFVLNPASLPTSGGTAFVQPMDERPAEPGDVIYCAGHTPLADGRVLYIGGSGFPPGGPSERGLEYARLYDPATRQLSRVEPRMKGGEPGHEGWRWYPTATRLPSGDALASSGFYWAGSAANRSIERFSPSALALGQDPWTVLATHTESPTSTAPNWSDYTHVTVLPAPVTGPDGRARGLSMFGAEGKVVFFTDASGVPGAQRFWVRPNAQRPTGSGGAMASGTLVGTGEQMLTGGAANLETGARADFYNPAADTWRSLPLGIPRQFPQTVLLPDGSTLVMSGFGGFDAPTWSPALGDRRRPQLVDPARRAVTTLEPWRDDALERGYHGWALLLKDARLLIGGGIAEGYPLYCERPDVRIYSPPYLSRGPRPVLTASQPVQLRIGGASVTVSASGASLRSQKGVVLMAPGSITHNFDQNQRIVPLQVTQSGSSLVIQPPANANIAPPGDYLLFGISTAGVPSVGLHVRLSK